MSNAGKALFSLFLVITMLTYIIYRSDIIVFDTDKETYTSAIRAAAQVATNEAIDTSDINNTYDGALKEASDIPTNLEAISIFKDTLMQLLESKKSSSLEGVTNINVPLTGFVTYEYILGITYDDTYLLPMGYTYSMNDVSVPGALNGKVWNFTLGNKVTIDSDDYTIQDSLLIKNSDKDIIYDLSSFLSKYGFKTLKEFANYNVMYCIDTYLNEYSGASFNPIAKNTQSEAQFELGKSNYSSNRLEYTTKSALIEGPGLFAIVDIYTGSGSNQHLYQRIASFGGSELVQA